MSQIFDEYMDKAEDDETEEEKIRGGLRALRRMLGANDDRYIALVHACGLSVDEVDELEKE